MHRANSNLIRRVLIGLAAIALTTLGFTAPAMACTSPQAGQDVAYCYDALGRLTEARYANGRNIVYTYDAAGNRTQVVVTDENGNNPSVAHVIVVPIGGFTVIPLPPN
ncbi:MAG: RHS repeat domain-containing protein [Pseudomonadota bacterium]